LPPWTSAGDAPLPASALSARVIKADQPILNAPSATGARRGSAARDARLPIFAALRGDGCRGRWLEVGPTAWVCEDAVELSANPPVRPDLRISAGASGLPFRYFFVGPDGSLGYKQLETADVGEPDFELGQGFAVAVVEERTFGGARYGRTNNGLWVPMRDLGPAHEFAFQGTEIPDGEGAGVPFGWVVADKAKVYAKPSLAAPTTATKVRFEQVPVLEEASSFAGKFARIGDGEWLSSKDVRHPTVQPPPSEVDAEGGERWIDIELASQTLVAYEGRRPVFATLVSTGKGRPGSPTATPTGTHRVWIKMLSSNMDNLEDENAARYYRMEDVPWVQYFSKGVGLHGAFWHRSFGNVRSHGCVNLAPLDAQRLFWWTSPHLPAGWTATTPTPLERGAVIRVR